MERAIQSGQTIYGINTGFGKLANVRVPADQLDQLQTNLIRSHASGVGAPLPEPVVRARDAAPRERAAAADQRRASGAGGRAGGPAQCRGSSAGSRAGKRGSQRRPGTAESHRARPDGRRPGARRAGGASAAPSAALKAARLSPYRFAPKEGIAFINGTQAQTAMLAMMVHDAKVLWRTAVGCGGDEPGSVARNARSPRSRGFTSHRPHPGQSRAAALMRELLENSEIRESHRENDPRVQDAYSLRCAPQVLGAVADAIRFAEQTPIVELNASTDNPLVFENGEVISGGNFHGQPVAQALDILALTLTTLQAIAERRVERLVNPDLSQGLPAFLTGDPGLCSGLMMVQIAAASLVAESEHWPCQRASVRFPLTPTRKISFRWEWRRRSRRAESWSTLSGSWPPSCCARHRDWSFSSLWTWQRGGRLYRRMQGT